MTITQFFKHFDNLFPLVESYVFLLGEDSVRRLAQCAVASQLQEVKQAMDFSLFLLPSVTFLFATTAVHSRPQGRLTTL